MRLQTYAQGIVEMLYPDLCTLCEVPLATGIDTICLKCRNHLPTTQFHHRKDNPFCERFYGRVPLVNGTSYLYFAKGNRVQQLMYQLKYYNKPEVGQFLGKQLATELKDIPSYQNIDGILPVPLHPKRLATRGYNQSQVFAEGLASVLGWPILKDALYRPSYTQSQTNKTIFERADNMEDVFAVREIDRLKGKHWLIVDDVMTTGATMEACANPLLSIPGIKISMATIAIAM